MRDTLFFWKLRLRRGGIVAYCAAALLVGAMSAWLYLPGPLAGLRAWRDVMPGVFQALGFLGGGALGIHVLETAYAFLLPLLVILHAAGSGGDYYARPLHDGRLAALLGSPHSRLRLLGTLFLAQAAELVLMLLAFLAGQVAVSAILIPGADLLALLRLTAGFLPVAFVYPAFSALAAFLAPGPKGAGRLTLLFSLLTLGFSMASRFPALSPLRMMTPLSLHRGLPLASGQGGLLEALYALPIAAFLYAALLILFSRRDL